MILWLFIWHHHQVKILISFNPVCRFSLNLYRNKCTNRGEVYAGIMSRWSTAGCSRRVVVAGCQVCHYHGCTETKTWPHQQFLSSCQWSPFIRLLFVLDLWFAFRGEDLCSFSFCSTPVPKPDWHRGAAESLMWHNIMIPTRCHRPTLYLSHPDKPPSHSHWSEILFFQSEYHPEHGRDRASWGADRMFPPPSGFPHTVCSLQHLNKLHNNSTWLNIHVSLLKLAQ